MSAAESSLYYPNQFQFTPNSSPSESGFPFHPINEIALQPFNNKDSFAKVPQFQSDLLRINDLQMQFNYELGITKTDKLNYNPVLARWKFESLTSPAEIEQFKQYELWQIQTALYERNQVEKNSVNYTIGKDGEIYNELFPDESFRNVLLRGLAYQQEHDTVEPEREQAEFDGWEEICTFLKNPETAEGTKAIVISPPGVAKGSMYRHNFIDTYEKHKGYIKMTRTNSNLSYEAYKNIAQHFEPDYFENSSAPIDAQFLKKPIYRNPNVDPRTVEEIMAQNFGIITDDINEQDKLMIWKEVQAVAQHFLDEALCKEYFDPKAIAKGCNAFLVKNDIVREIRKKQKNNPTELQTGNIKQFESIHDEVTWLGTKNVQQVAAACGMSDGFNINSQSSSSPLESILSNSVGKFGVEKDDKGPLEFNCPACEYKNRRPYGKLIKFCQNSKCPDPEAISCKNDKEQTSITK